MMSKTNISDENDNNNNNNRLISNKRVFNSLSSNATNTSPGAPYIKQIIDNYNKPKLPQKNLYRTSQNIAPPEHGNNHKQPTNNYLVVANSYKVGRKIGNGNFGELHLGKNIYSSDYVAIKFEKTNAKIPLLSYESKFYKRLCPNPGLPKLHYFGQTGKYNTLVIELLGANLEDLFNLCKRRFSLKTMCMLAIQLLQRIEYVHSKNIIHRDIKPENFLIGRQSLNKHRNIHIIDFGLANEYIDSDTGKHIPYTEQNSLTGTARYMSINTHMGREQSRRDDIEAIGYLLMYFLRGGLPWQGLKSDTMDERNRRIGIIKQQTSLEELCGGYPREFADLIRYARNLDFTETPDYKMLIRSFENLMKSKGWWPIDWEFDWVEKFKEYSKNINANNS